MSEHDMADPLRYAIHLVLPVDRIDAEKLAAAIRTEIDERVHDQLLNYAIARVEAAKPQPAEPDPDDAFVAQSHINDDCVTDCPWCAKDE